MFVRFYTVGTKLTPSKTTSIISKQGQKVTEQQKYSTIKYKLLFEFDSVYWF